MENIEYFGPFFFSSNPSNLHLHHLVCLKKFKKTTGMGMGMGMGQVWVWVCLYPTYTQTHFEHTRPIALFPPILISIPVINEVDFLGLGGTPIPSLGQSSNSMEFRHHNGL